MSTLVGVMAEEKKSAQITVYNMLKTHTKCAHGVFGKGRSANLMRDLFMSEHF